MNLKQKHLKTLDLMTRLNALEQEWSDHRNELLEIDAYEEGKQTINRLHKEMLQVDKALVDKLDS